MSPDGETASPSLAVQAAETAKRAAREAAQAAEEAEEAAEEAEEAAEEAEVAADTAAEFAEDAAVSADLDRHEDTDEDSEIIDGVAPHTGRHPTVTFKEKFNGPLPHPRHIQQYTEIYPEAAEIIFRSFDDQGKHRRELEKQLLAGSERRATIGQVLGTTLVAAVIVLGFFCVIGGQAVAGTTMVGLALTGGVLTYVFGDFPGKNK